MHGTITEYAVWITIDYYSCTLFESFFLKFLLFFSLFFFFLAVADAGDFEVSPCKSKDLVELFTLKPYEPELKT